MTPTEIQEAVLMLNKQGTSLRETSRILGLSRNTVRRLLRGPAARQQTATTVDRAMQQRLAAVYERARGNAVRMAQILAEEDELQPAYSTLTRWVRQAELRAPPRRSGQYHFEPGQEMQHDTSPHRLEIAGKTVTAQCEGLTLAYSRRLFIQYAPRFTRFEAKHFLLQAAQFMDGTCRRCIVDNTSVVLAGGSGESAVIAPEMKAFARTLGFEFGAHRIMDPNRKGRIERPFRWVEDGFLPGRSFASFDDLNAQALQWCVEVANPKPRRALGMSAEAAYVMEKPYLAPLPAVLPAVYVVFDRVVDLYGFVSVDTNRYSLPERLVGKTVSVYKYPASIEIQYRSLVVASHPRLIGVREMRHTISQHLNGRGTRALNRLVQLKRSYPAQPFIAAIEQALKYGLFDLSRLETLVLRHVAGDFFALDDDDQEGDPSERA